MAAAREVAEATAVVLVEDMVETLEADDIKSFSGLYLQLRLKQPNPPPPDCRTLNPS